LEVRQGDADLGLGSLLPCKFVCESNPEGESGGGVGWVGVEEEVGGRESGREAKRERGSGRCYYEWVGVVEASRKCMTMFGGTK